MYEPDENDEVFTVELDNDCSDFLSEGNDLANFNMLVEDLYHGTPFTQKEMVRWLESTPDKQISIFEKHIEIPIVFEAVCDKVRFMESVIEQLLYLIDLMNIIEKEKEEK